MIKPFITIVPSIISLNGFIKIFHILKSHRPTSLPHQRVPRHPDIDRSEDMVGNEQHDFLVFYVAVEPDEITPSVHAETTSIVPSGINPA